MITFFQQQGTVKAYANFNAEQDAEVLHGAMKGLGTDEECIINVVCYRSNPQRQEICSAYKTMFGKVGFRFILHSFCAYKHYNPYPFACGLFLQACVSLSQEI